MHIILFLRSVHYNHNNNNNIYVAIHIQEITIYPKCDPNIIFEGVVLFEKFEGKHASSALCKWSGGPFMLS